MSSASVVATTERFFASWRFPALALGALGAFDLGIGALSLFPRAESGFGRFAEQFRVWCWGYDPTSGHVEWAYGVGMLGPPLLLGLVIAFVWARPLREIARQRSGALLKWAGAGLCGTILALGVLATSRDDADAAELPFPARALRTAHPAPDFTLADQNGEQVSLEGLRGKVVVLTGMYASCSVTCPLIMARAKHAIDALEPSERRDVRFVAITLDPEHDDQAVLSRLAQAYGVHAPNYEYLWGEPKCVNSLLDRFEIARKMDMSTGVIEHVNLFILLDRTGKVAFRLSLAQREQSWLTDALRLLVRERPTAR